MKLGEAWRMIWKKWYISREKILDLVKMYFWRLLYLYNEVCNIYKRQDYNICKRNTF